MTLLPLPHCTIPSLGFREPILTWLLCPSIPLPKLHLFHLCISGFHPQLSSHSIQLDLKRKMIHRVTIQLLSRVWLFGTPCLLNPRPPCPSPTPRVYSNSCPLSRWCHPTVSSSVVPFSFCLQSFPASGSFQMSQFFASGGQSIGVSASASVLPMNIQDWFPLGWGNSQGIRKKGKNELHKSHLRSTKLELGEAAVMWFLEKTPKIILTTPFVLERTTGLTALPVWS